MRFYSVIAFIWVCTGIVSAQNLSVFDLDASGFPTMKAKFYAFDANGQQQSPSLSEITVTEDGIARNVISVTCPPKKTVPKISLAMSLDVSGSMGGSDFGDVPVELGKSTMSTLVPLIIDGASEFALQTCNDHAFIIQDFTTKRNKILSEISSLTAGGGNDFVEHLLNPQTGILNIAKTGKYKRIAVLYTDAWWYALSASELQQCIDLCTKNNITFFAIIYSRPEADPNGIKTSLKTLAEATGGMFFDGIDSKQAAKDVANQIQKLADSQSPCEISWQSGSSCIDEKIRSAEAAWKGVKAPFSYPFSANYIAHIQITPSYFFLGGKTIGKQFDTSITITASNSGFTVINITSTNSAFDVNPKSFSLTAGESKTLTVSFTPPDSSYSWAEFTIETDICPQTFFVSGGYPGVKPKLSPLELTEPNGGEVFSAGSDTTVTWKGIPLTDKVKLQYSSDAGSSWHLISPDASNGTYRWNVPNISSTKCLASVTQFGPSDASTSPWPIVEPASVKGGGEGITTDLQGNIYVTGYFCGKINFDGKHTLDAGGSCDMFVAKYHPDATLEWVTSAGGTVDCDGRSIVVDPMGNVYVTGFFMGTPNFSGVTLSGYADYDIFIAKYHPDGTLDWVKQAGGDLWDLAFHIALDPTGNDIYITGYFTNSATFGTTQIPGSGNQAIYMAKYHSDGTLDWVTTPGGGGTLTGGYCMAVGPSGNIYLIGTFAGAVNFGGIPLTSSGYDDIFIVKYRPDGTVVWAKHAGGSGSDDGSGIALDAAENIYVTGNFINTADFDGLKLTSSPICNDIFVAKYDSSGKIIWVNHSGASPWGPTGGFATGGEIVVDDAGNVSIAGWYYSDSLYIGPFRFKNYSKAGFPDILIAQYSNDGNLLWAKRAGGINEDRAYGITADFEGSIYATGTIGASSDLGPIKLSSTDTGGIFIWKFGNESFQSDTSETVFSIVKPQPLSEDVDMGKVLVATAKDSSVSGFIRNAGTFPFRVDSIAIIGTNASQFSIASGIPPFDIPPAGAHHVEFVFLPASAGIKSAQIEIFTQADTLFQNITGEGIQPTLAVMGNVIDFGQVTIGSNKDTTITVAIQNVGGVPVSFSSSAQLGPDMVQFSLQSGVAPFTLAPGASQSVTLRFAPKFIGRTSGRIGFDYGANSPAILTVFGQGLGGLVRIPDDSGYAGDHKNIPMILEKVPVTSVQSVATNFQARVAYDKTVLCPSAGSIQHGNRFDTLTISSSLGASDTLALIPFIAMLGQSKTSPMNIVDFAWLDGAGQPADYDNETESGTFYLLGICPAGGARLFNPDGQISMAHINPNPANGIIHIDIQTTEIGTTRLELMNLLGQTIATIADGDLKPGNHSFDFNSHDLSGGSYFLVMQTPTVRKLQRIDIAK